MVIEAELTTLLRYRLFQVVDSAPSLVPPQTRIACFNVQMHHCYHLSPISHFSPAHGGPGDRRKVVTNDFLSVDSLEFPVSAQLSKSLIARTAHVAAESSASWIPVSMT